jgi:hypothetical protein
MFVRYFVHHFHLETNLNSLKSSCSLMAALLCHLLCQLLCTSPTYSADAASWQSNQPAKPLAFNDVNEQLHKNYAHAKDEIRQKLGPIVFCTNMAISLHKGKDVTTVPFQTPRYTGLKQVSHITLGSFFLLTNHTDEKLSADQIERLKAYKAGIEKAAPELQTNQGLVTEDDAKQQELIKKTLAFLGKVIDDKQVSHSDLRTFVRSCTVSDLENAYEAAGSQIRTMDDTMAKWHKEMTDEEWNKLHVIILTGHMPRPGLLSYQYFSKLLCQNQEGEQIIVAEGLTDEEQAIDLLLTHIIDGKVAVEFFQDPWRMHRDLLSDGGELYLKEHKLQANWTGK